MNAQVLSSTKQEINISVKESDIATLYIIQHELLKDSNVECWVRINSKSNPIQDLKKATDSAIKIADDVKKLFNSKIKE